MAAFLCGLFAFLDLYCTQPLLPLFAQVFHASRSAVGTTVSASTFGVAIAAALLALFGQRLPRKRTILVGLSIRSVVTLLCALATSIPTLAAARFLQGLLVPTVSVMTVAYVTEEWPPERVPRAMSVYVSGTVLGGFLGRFLSGLIAEETSWQHVFVVLSLLGGLGVVAIARLLPPSRSVSAPTPRLDALRRTLHDPRLLATFGVGICMLFTLVGAFSYVTFYLSAPPFSLTTSQLSWLFVVYLFGLFATLVAGRGLSPERLRHGLYASASTVVIGLLFTLWRLTGAVAVGLALVGTGVFIAQTCTNAFLRDASPAEARVTATGTDAPPRRSSREMIASACAICVRVSSAFGASNGSSACEPESCAMPPRTPSRAAESRCPTRPTPSPASSAQTHASAAKSALCARTRRAAIMRPL